MMKNQPVQDDLDVEDVQNIDLQCHHVSALRSYLELMRLPNVFTSMADVAMGFLFVQAVGWQWQPWWDSWTLALLLATSSMLYIAGVVLNDVFDLDVDRQERPHRPLPSGRISLPAARRMGWNLLFLGVLLSVGACYFAGHMRPGIVAALLAACIVLYDAWLKNTLLGPVAMGACRTLNVLLGMNAVDAGLGMECWLVAGGLGVYVAGITWFARREAGESTRLQLGASTLVMMLGIGLMASFPNWSTRTIPQVQYGGQRWYWLVGMLGLLAIWRCFWAAAEPAAFRVRIAVAQCVLSIIMLDAVMCYAIRGIPWAGAIMLLLVPAMFLGRWVEST